jgi:hypothetical protein
MGSELRNKTGEREREREKERERERVNVIPDYTEWTPQHGTLTPYVTEFWQH